MVKLGILGSGIITESHFFALDKVSDAKVAAIASADEESGKKACEKYGAKYYKDYRDLLGKEKDLDGIIVALPNHMHFEGCKAAIEEGFKYILCEKPLCTNSEDSEKLVQMVESNGVFFQTAYMKRFNPGFQLIKKVLPDIGDLEFVTFSIYLSCPEPSVTGKIVPKTWHGDAKLSGGGLLAHSGSHHLDLIRYCFGDVASVSCKLRYDSEDGRDYYLLGHILMESGVDVDFRIGRTDIPDMGPDWKVLRGGGWNETVEVIGTKGYIKVENPTWQGYEPIKVTRWMNGMPGPESFHFECNKQWINELAAFVESCKTGIMSENGSSVADGYRVDLIIEKMRESDDLNGAEVALDYKY